MPELTARTCKREGCSNALPRTQRYYCSDVCQNRVAVGYQREYQRRLKAGEIQPSGKARPAYQSKAAANAAIDIVVARAQAENRLGEPEPTRSVSIAYKRLFDALYAPQEKELIETPIQRHSRQLAERAAAQAALDAPRSRLCLYCYSEFTPIFDQAFCSDDCLRSDEDTKAFSKVNDDLRHRRAA